MRYLLPLLLVLASCDTLKVSTGKDFHHDQDHGEIQLQEDRYITGFARVGDDNVWYGGAMFPIFDLPLSLSFAPGYYDAADDDSGITFRSSLEFSYPILSGIELVAEYIHLSDANLNDTPTRDSVLFGVRLRM